MELAVTKEVTVLGESSLFFHCTKLPATMLWFEGRKFSVLSEDTPVGMSMQVAVAQEMGLGLVGKTRKENMLPPRGRMMGRRADKATGVGWYSGTRMRVHLG